MFNKSLRKIPGPDASVRPLGRNIRLEIEYDGTNYCGWQVQKRPLSLGHRPSIQEVIEKTLQKILQEKIKLTASGRTDAGVHALAQTANFKTNSKIGLEKLRKALNSLLPDDIAVTKIAEAPLNFHSRFSARSKIYRYTILNRPTRSGILRNTVWFFPHPLNLRLMRKEAKTLLGRHNFKSFQAVDREEKKAKRTIKNLKISRSKDFVYIDIEADGFLYNMARNIVGTLIEVGRGKFPAGSTKKILHSANRAIAGPTAPARGLCLLKVKYKPGIKRSGSAGY